MAEKFSTEQEQKVELKEVIGVVLDLKHILCKSRRKVLNRTGTESM
jgi:hypothetical protein